MPATGMRERILETAERRVRATGFVSLSFRDIAADLGIKSASVHYHFPKKADLGEALISHYSEKFSASIEAIQTDVLDDALRDFIDLYNEALRPGESACLCALVGAEANGLDPSMRSRLDAFFQLNESWLRQVFAKHRAHRPDELASIFLTSLEGAMIVATATGDKAVFERVSGALLDLPRAA